MNEERNCGIDIDLFLLLCGFTLAVVLFFSNQADAQETFVTACAQRSSCPLTSGEQWSNAVNRVWIITPLYPTESIYVFVHNRNPTSAHISQSLKAFITGTSSPVSLLSNPDRWTQAVVNQNTIPGASCNSVNPSSPTSAPGAANGTGTCYIKAMTASQVAFFFTGGNSQSGNPDTYDVDIVQQPGDTSGPMPGTDDSYGGGAATQTFNLNATGISNAVCIPTQNQMAQVSTGLPSTSAVLQASDGNTSTSNLLYFYLPFNNSNGLRTTTFVQTLTVTNSPFIATIVTNPGDTQACIWASSLIGGPIQITLNASNGGFIPPASLTSTQALAQAPAGNPNPLALIVEKGSRWTIKSNPASGSLAQATKAAAGANIRHVVDSICFSGVSSGGAVVASPGEISIQDNGVIVWVLEIDHQVASLAGVQTIAPFCAVGLNVVISANSPVQCTLDSAVANEKQSVSCTGYDAN